MHTGARVDISSGSFRQNVEPLVRDALAGYRDIRRILAHAGVAVFSISLLLPTLAPGPLRGDGAVLVGGSLEELTAAALERVAPPNVREPAPRPEPTAGPVQEPAATPLIDDARDAGALVLASWYGPGFYGNRLPCWPWLQATGKPIALEPDTWGVANKTLPCGTMLVLTHGSNTVTVPVVDRGPYVAGRDLDLAPAVKAALGCTDLCSLLLRIP